MTYIQPGPVYGNLQAPPSKSHLQRLLLAASLAQGESVLLSPGDSEDGLACRHVIETLGSEVEEQEDRLLVRGGGLPRGLHLDCGESGFCFRAAAALAALWDRPFTILGRGSLATRPVDMVVGPLQALGAQCTSTEGQPPLHVHGPLTGGVAIVRGHASSQALSGLLLALPRAPGKSTLVVKNLRSLPYVRMTLEVLDAFGVRVEAGPSFERFDIPGNQIYRSGIFSVEGDWSGAAFWLVAAALLGDVTIAGLRRDSLQADRAILRALDLAGAAHSWDGDALRVEQSCLRAIEFDATDCPDLFPPLAAMACHAHGRSRISGVERLKFKESDRAAALVSELRGMGARIEVAGNVMEITGGMLLGGAVEAHGDHRIAMACAVAALRSQKGVAIDDAACVAKSYPAFFRHLALLQGDR